MAYETSIWGGQLQLDAFWVFENYFAAEVILMNLQRHYLIVLQLVFQYINPIELLLKYNNKINISVPLASALRMNIELRNELYLLWLCSSGSWTIDSFYHFSMSNNNFKEVMNCKTVIGKLLQ